MRLNCIRRVFMCPAQIDATQEGLCTGTEYKPFGLVRFVCGISGLRAADVEVRVDGDPRTNFSYDANSGALSLAGGRMMEGRHSVKITAADAQELTTSKRSALQPVSQRAPSADGALLVLLVWSFCRSCLRSLCRPADRLGPYVDAAVYVEG